LVTSVRDGHISEDKEELKGMSLGTQSGREANDTKGNMTGMGPFLDTPPFWMTPL
jgi:hypothetical protein